MDAINQKLNEFNKDVEHIWFVKELSEITGLPACFFGTLILVSSVAFVAFNLPYATMIV